MVYVINAQDCYNSFGEIGKVRNRLFTAMTRSKAWVRVVGHGKNMRLLKSEYDRVVENNYQLKFIYPNSDLRAKLRVVNRDMSLEEKKHVKEGNAAASALLKQLSKGQIQLDDLSETVLNELRRQLGQ